MAAWDLIAGLLEDLDTLAQVAESGVLSRRETRLEPGETRPAAIVFLDVVGFTSLSKKLTSQQLSLLIDRTFRIFELTIKGQGGYWDARFGDAALYVFPGHPNYPPACRAALLAGLALIDRASQIARSLDPMGLSLAIRVGVSFGEVTRQHVGGGDKPLTVMGDTVNLAQRLEASAAPMSLQTTVRVLDQAGAGFGSEYRDAFELKGFGRVEVHQVTSAPQAQLRLRGSARRLTPLIGREKLLQWAWQMLHGWLEEGIELRRGELEGSGDEAVGNTPRNALLVIHGATAVGKSRLAYELVERLKADGPLNTATGHCSELSSVLAFGAELAQAAGLDSENLPVRWEALCANAALLRGEDYAQRAREHLPVLALLLDCLTVDASGVRRSDAKSFLVSVMLALRACCELAALENGRPVVLVVEDLQWMGELEELISDLLANTRLPFPLIVVATARPNYVPQPGSLGEAEMEVLELRPLSAAHCDRLFEALLPGLQLPPAVMHELHEKAIGLPYYYEEFARLLVRRGIARPVATPASTAAEERYELASEIMELEMPADIQMLILGRLDQLEPWLRELTGRLSIWGRSFQRSLHWQLESRLSLLSEHEYSAGLDMLMSLQLLDKDPGDRFYFEHLLTRDCAYHALLSNNRILLHLSAANVLQDQLIPGSAEEADILPELATHLEAAGQFSDAHQRCCQFLSLKAQTGRFEQWEHWEDAARRCWNKLRDSNPGLAQDSQMLLNALGTRYRMTGEWDAAGAAYRQALEQVRISGDRRTEASLLNNLGSLLRVQGRIDEAQDCYREALALAREFGRLRLEAVVLRNLGTLARETGEQEEALALYREALERSRDARDLRNAALVLDNLGMVYMDRWMADEAEESFGEALKILREIRVPWGEALVLGNLGLLRMKYLRMDEARECLNQSIELAREVGDPRLEGETLGKRANLLLRQRELKAARPDLKRALDLLAQVGNPFQLAFVHCQWVFFHLAMGQQESARRSLREARRLAGQIEVNPRSALWREIDKCEAALAAAGEKTESSAVGGTAVEG